MKDPPLPAWSHLKRKWAARFPWLGVALRDGAWRMGCRQCRKASLPGAFSQFAIGASKLDTSHLVQHERSKSHKAAASAAAAVSADSGTAVSAALQLAASAGAPPPEEFLSTMKSVEEGGAVLSGTKDARKTWCIGEAMRALDQAFFEKASAITLIRDERNARLQVRYIAVAPNLEVRCGTLGQAREFGTGASNVTRATGVIIRRACSRFLGAPGAARGICKKRPFVKKKLWRHFRDSVIGVTVDAASDEVLSARMMTSVTLSGLREKLTPNLKFIVRDKPHASRRLISRPFAADEFLKDVIMNFARGRGSMARLIQGSNEARRVFQKHARTSTSEHVRVAITNLRAAPHRFESFQKPLGRSCLYLHALLKTALHIAQFARVPDTAMKAKNWLAWLDTEKAVAGAMLADAMDHTLAFTRFLDTESVDPATMAREIEVFLNVGRNLFGGTQPACCSVFGYTATMLEELKSPVVWIVGGETRTLGCDGGVPRSVLDRCLGRMSAWFHLVEKALRAECPSFELCQAFQVFDLAMMRQPAVSAAAEPLERIARACAVDAVKLKAQWQDFWPRARALASRGNKEAWRFALASLDNTHGWVRHPSEELRQALVTYFAHGLSTSGVEQAFSKGVYVFHKRRFKAGPFAEECVLKVAWDLPHRDRQVVSRLAAKIWSLMYGVPRCTTRPRSDKGLKRRLGKYTEKAFVQKRRTAAAASVAAVVNVTAVSATAASGATDAYQAEEGFQAKKYRRREVEACADGLLLPYEESHALQTEAANWALQQEHDQRLRRTLRVFQAIRASATKCTTKH